MDGHFSLERTLGQFRKDIGWTGATVDYNDMNDLFLQMFNYVASLLETVLDLPRPADVAEAPLL